MEGEEPPGRRASVGGRKEGSKASRLKERWLLTRKTWRYMSDAGKKLFPEGVNPHRAEDLPRVAQHFQHVNNRQQDFILWPQPPDTPKAARRTRQRQASHASDTSEEYGDSDPEGAVVGPAARPPATVGGSGGVDVGVGVSSTVGVTTLPGPYPCSGSPGTSPGASWAQRERLVSLGELRWEVPPELYQQLLRAAGSCTLQHVASRLQEEQLTEEDEEDEEGGEDDEPEDLLCVVLPGHRSVGVQTEPRLDMCVQTDADAAAEDMVKVGAETRSVTEAAAAAAQAQAQGQAQQRGPAPPAPGVPPASEVQEASTQPPDTPEVPATAPSEGSSSTAMLKKLWQRRESAASASLKAEEAAKDGRREAGGAKGSQVAAKLAWAERAAAAGGGTPPSPMTKPEKPAEKSRLKNVFKLGLKCDVEGGGGGGGAKKVVDKTKVDKFKTVNYDKTLRNIKSRWKPSPEDEALLQQYRQHLGARDPRKIKRKSRGIQVGEPLPQFILAGIRINAPVEIVHQRRRIGRWRRRRVSKADSSDLSSSECSASVPPSLPTSPRYSVTVTDEAGAARDLLLGEAELLRLASLGVLPVPMPLQHLKRPSMDASVDTSEFDSEVPGGVAGSGGLSLGYQRSLSALQASGHLAQLLAAIRSRVMQRSRAAGSGGGHGSRLVAKKMWRARSKSQSRASPANTSVWTPVGGNMWSSVTGRLVSVEKACLLHLTELERLTLQQVTLAKIQALNLGCAVRVPTEHTGSGGQKKRRPYLLKRKALTTGIFENKKEEVKDGMEGGQVFGLPLIKCLENERVRTREAAEKAALAAAAAAATAAAAGGEEQHAFSRKSSQGGSHASFSSLNEATKQSSTGSLESLNLDRKRPSLAGSTGGGGGGVGGGGDGLGLSPSPLTADLLVVEPSPQIPGLVSTCLRYLQTNGLHTLGLFRVSSSKKRVRQLREEFDRGGEVWLSDDHCPHDVATLLKEFFRDLPEPLLTRELYEPFIKTQKIRNRKLQFEALQHLVQLMPVANRDTLYSLLTFLATVAEHSTDRISETGEKLQGNKMDSSNLATLFAPNILHAVRPAGGGGGGGGGVGGGGCDSQSTMEMAQHAEEVISVVRAMIDHNKDLFEVPAELMDETYQHLMDTHPEALDILLRRRCAGGDDRGQHLQELLACLLDPNRPRDSLCQALDLEVETGSSICEGSECSSSLPRSPTDPHLHHDFDRRRLEEEEDCRGRRAREDKAWFRRRDKSSSRERDDRGHQHQQQQQQHQQETKGSRWFRRRDKSCDETAGRRRGPTTSTAATTVPEAGPRRLSSPEIERPGVITASLRIPVPVGAASRPQEECVEARHKTSSQRTGSGAAGAVVGGGGGGGGSGRQRSGSSDSYLGQPITAAMTFQPLSKKSGDRLSHDSVLSSSSADAFTLSPSPRHTPLSDPSASGASSPLSRTGSPPPWLSPDSGTPGLSPPSSPPVHTRRRTEPRASVTTPTTITTTAATTRAATAPTRVKASPVGHLQPQGAFPLGRSRTADNIKPEAVQTEGGTVTRRGGAARRYTRRRYTGERHPTGQLPDLSGGAGEGGAAGGEGGHATLWKRWEIIASDPTEPETFV